VHKPLWPAQTSPAVTAPRLFMASAPVVQQQKRLPLLRGCSYLLLSVLDQWGCGRRGICPQYRSRKFVSFSSNNCADHWRLQTEPQPQRARGKVDMGPGVGPSPRSQRCLIRFYCELQTLTNGRNYLSKCNVKQSLYTPWRRLGGEEV
jgi:hypothetical protein